MNQEYVMAENKHKYILKKFERFLKEKRVFDAFYYYCYNGVMCNHNPILHNNPTFDGYIIAMQKKKLLHLLIFSSFVWMHTVEGYSFWSQIDKEWQKIYSEITNKSLF